MNQTALETITCVAPNKRQQYAKFIAVGCMIQYPTVTRADERCVWSILVRTMLSQPDFMKWIAQRDIMGWRKFVKLAYDVWTYYLTLR